ncbi:MAG: phosphatidate cytidylyltransferase [Spirochaetales bacterium]|nr:phosphatidate cytidylyltransferase [Spirochaetales bacterium]
MRISNVSIASGVGAEEIKTELLRKSIHFLIALVPTIASLNLGFTVALLGAGVMVYAWAETLRLSGRRVILITRLTDGAARQRDKGRFVLGPVTLGLGAMMTLLLYPEPAAAIGIYALAFGDGIASLVGKLLPVGRMAFLEGKTLSGSFACFTAIYMATYITSGSIEMAFFIGLIGTSLEALPSKDLDNIIIPVGTGLAATLMLGLPL